MPLLLSILALLMPQLTGPLFASIPIGLACVSNFVLDQAKARRVGLRITRSDGSSLPVLFVYEVTPDEEGVKKVTLRDENNLHYTLLGHEIVKMAVAEEVRDLFGLMADAALNARQQEGSLIVFNWDDNGTPIEAVGTIADMYSKHRVDGPGKEMLVYFKERGGSVDFTIEIPLISIDPDSIRIVPGEAHLLERAKKEIWETIIRSTHLLADGNERLVFANGSTQVIRSGSTKIDLVGEDAIFTFTRPNGTALTLTINNAIRGTRVVLPLHPRHVWSDIR